MDHTLAVFERGLQGLPQSGFVGRVDQQVSHRQFDSVFFETVDARKAGGRQKLAVHPQVRIAAWSGPIGEFGVDALAVDDQRRQQTDVLAAVVFDQLRSDTFGALRHHRRTVMGAMLDAELDV